MKCNFCGKTNTEITSHKLKPVSISDWLSVIFTLGLIRHKLCQTCNSKIFRGLKKEL
jgi:hypothetical protein